MFFLYFIHLTNSMHPRCRKVAVIILVNQKNGIFRRQVIRKGLVMQLKRTRRRYFLLSGRCIVSSNYRAKTWANETRSVRVNFHDKFASKYLVQRNFPAKEFFNFVRGRYFLICASCRSWTIIRGYFRRETFWYTRVHCGMPCAMRWVLFFTF